MSLTPFNVFSNSERGGGVDRKSPFTLITGDNITIGTDSEPVDPLKP